MESASCGVEMDAAMLRLNLRRQRLQKSMEEAKIIIDSSAKEGVELRDLFKIQYNLKRDIENLSQEMKNLISSKTTALPAELVTDCTVKEIEAEDILGTLAALEKAGTMERPSRTNTKLPKIVLPKFDGDVLNWQQFWDRFEPTIHKSDLPEAEKLAYLMGCLDGQALNKITGLSTTNINYPIAIKLLEEKYGGKRRLIDSHYNALFKIQKLSPNATDCRKTLDEVEKHMRVLKELGEDTDGNHFRAAIMNKFPDNIMYQLHLQSDPEDSTQNLLKHLDKIITALERMGDTNEHTSTTAVLNVTSKLRVSKECKNQAKTSKIIAKKRKLEDPLKQLQKKQKPSCIFCEGSHFNDECQKVKTREERLKKLTGRCFVCFRKGHEAKVCRLKRKCAYCDKHHNRALCPKKLSSHPKQKDPSSQSGKVASNNTDAPIRSNCLYADKRNTMSFLQTATVRVANENKTTTCRLLLDCGSQRSYITSRMAEQLGLIPDREDHLIVYTFGSDNPKEMPCPSVEFEVITKRNFKKTIRANVVPHITEKLPIAKVKVPDNIDILADDDSTGEKIDLLIGNDYYLIFCKGNEHIHVKDNLFLINTTFGWIVSGGTSATYDNILSVVTYCNCHDTDYTYYTEPDLPLRNIDMKFLWTLESIGITDSPKATQQEETVKYFNDTVELRNGRYFIKWPWVQYPPELPTNFGLAFGRLKGLLKRLDKDNLKEYEEILKEQLQAGVIEIIEPKSNNEQSTTPVHYLPHHIVKQEGKRGRIVYDASAKIKDNKSLNEAMYKGPSMLEDLTGLLIKFRTGKVGITGDIEKAFLQIGLQEDARDVTRFLWVKDLTKDLTTDNLLYLRFCRVPFGIISSPFLLTATLRHHLMQKDDALMKKIAKNFYVDNLVTNAESTTEAVQLFEKARNAFKEISMNIRDWTSNSKEFSTRIPEECRSKQKDRVKLLGLIWNVHEDTLELKINEDMEDDNTVTKRDVLKTLARVYDPCGFAAPLILPSKLLFQELCTMKVKWDTALPNDKLQIWNMAKEYLKAAKDIKVPRFIGLEQNEEDEVQYELHCFTDASKNAYAAVVYLLAYNKNKAKTTLIMSKARITPSEDKEDLKIPRLELLGYLIGKRLLKYVKSNLELNIQSQYLWTDSLIVLYWMRSNKLQAPFVSRRINEIKQMAGVEYCYINTTSNPADVATRPELWYQKIELWFAGPEFLTKPKNEWPKTMYTHIGEEATSLFAGEALHTVDGPEMVMKGYETYEDMDTADKQVMEEHIPNNNNNEDETPLIETPANIRKLQARYFSDEVAGKVTHLTGNLGLFTDIDGILRCRGRLSNTNWSYEKKYPALIPRDSRFTNELIKKYHEENYHVGVSHTLSIIRQKYWIPQGRAQVQKVLKKCPQCVKHGGGPYKLPNTPALPVERVNYATPFTYTGIDYLGPLFVNTEKGKQKRWVCLLTCLAVRAIHLEIVNNLTAEECLLALRRFIAARGVPQMLISDNAQTFKLTSEVLATPYCKNEKICWKFIPQLAPWHGGFYERLVFLVKHCLKRTLEKHLLTDSQLSTVIKEVETVVNTRPLTYVGADLEDILRPADFLTLGKCLNIDLTNEDFTQGTQVKVDLVNSWKRGHRLLKDFEKMFSDQYLSSLRERFKSAPKQQRVTTDKSPKVGDVVQIKDSSKNRSNWKVGKITCLIKGQDGECRVAKVKVGKNEFTRSIGHLYPLEDTLPPDDRTTSNPSLPAQLEILGSEPDEQSHMEIDPPEELCNEVTTQTDVAETHITNEKVVDDDSNSQEQTPVSPNILNLPENVTSIEGNTERDNSDGEEVRPPVETRVRRNAAIRARQQIAEWTRQLLAYLLQ